MALGLVDDAQDVDVTIVGGGPTGLFTGLLLHQMGVSVCIIDGKPATLDRGRADALNARTQQYLEVAKVLDDLLPQGIKCNTSSTFGDGEFKSRQSAWWVNLEHTLHKNFLMVGQPVVEKVLSSRLDGLVRYGEHVVSVSEGDELVEVTTDAGRRVRSKFVVGADGARSTVRGALGVSFSGTKPGMLWAVLDTFIETDFPACPEIITFQLDGQSRVSWIPRERGMCRFYVLLDGPVTQQRAEESIKRHLAPYRVDFKRTEWFSNFDVKERIASSFVSRDGAGRVVLAGDAAHVHSVNGGQGLNTGLADAFGLAWRLAAMMSPAKLKAGAAANLMRSYDAERRATAQRVIDLAAALVRGTVQTAAYYVATIEKNASYITGMGVSYQGLGSALVAESEHGIWKAGARCPDVVVELAGKGSSRLYRETTYGKFLVLLVGGGGGGHEDARVGHEDVAVVRRALPRGAPGSAGEEAPCFLADWVGAGDVYSVVIRPDMYVGYVGDDAGGCRRYLEQVYA